MARTRWGVGVGVGGCATSFRCTGGVRDETNSCVLCRPFFFPRRESNVVVLYYESSIVIVISVV